MRQKTRKTKNATIHAVPNLLKHFSTGLLIILIISRCYTEGRIIYKLSQIIIYPIYYLYYLLSVFSMFAYQNMEFI